MWHKVWLRTLHHDISLVSLARWAKKVEGLLYSKWGIIIINISWFYVHVWCTDPQPTNRRGNGEEEEEEEIPGPTLDELCADPDIIAVFAVSDVAINQQCWSIYYTFIDI